MIRASALWRFDRSTRRPMPISVALVASMLCASALAQSPAPLSLEDALRLAQSRSRQLIAQDAAASAARSSAVAAGQRPDPLLRAGINNLPIDGSDRFSVARDFMTMRSVGVMQEITREGKLKARSARLEREAEALGAGRDLVLANLQRDTALAWLDRYYAEQMRRVLLAQRDEARLQIEAADAVYRGGRGSQTDLFAARSAVAQIEDRVAQTDRQIETATTLLGRWVGEAAGGALGSPPALDVVRLRAEDLDAQLIHHPQIAIMVKQEATAQAGADVARTNKQSDISVELMYSQRGPAFSNMVSLNVSIPLQWDQSDRQDRELAARLATVEQMRAEREEATRAHVAEALTMLQEWRSNRARLASYDSSLLPLSSQRTRAALTAYRGSTGLLSAVLDARRSEIDTRMERLRLEMEAARLWAQLEYLVPAGHDATGAARP